MQQGNGIVNDIDVTEVKNKTMPKSWICPHCKKKNPVGMYANGILLNFGKYIEQCTKCGNLHLFRLKLTDDFKKKMLDFLKTGLEQD